MIATDSTRWNFERHLDISCTIIIIIIAFTPPAYLLSQALIWVYEATLTLKWVNLSNDWKCKWNTGARRWLKFKPLYLSFVWQSTESLKLENKFHIFFVLSRRVNADIQLSYRISQLKSLDTSQTATSRKKSSSLPRDSNASVSLRLAAAAAAVAQSKTDLGN